MFRSDDGSCKQSNRVLRTKNRTIRHHTIKSWCCRLDQMVGTWGIMKTCLRKQMLTYNKLAKQANYQNRRQSTNGVTFGCNPWSSKWNSTYGPFIRKARKIPLNTHKLDIYEEDEPLHANSGTWAWNPWISKETSPTYEHLTWTKRKMSK